MKQPKFFLHSGDDARELRRKLRLNQMEFWLPIGVTQSGGSRYEAGRNIPTPVRLLLHLTYASEKQAAAMLAFLREKP